MTEHGPASRFDAAAEALFLAAIVAAPWPFGSTHDVARYALAAVLLVATALWLGGLVRSGRGLPRSALRAAGLPALGIVQLALGRSAAPVWTFEAFLVLTAGLGTLAFWTERARDRRAATRFAWVVAGAGAAQAAFGAVQWSLGPDLLYGRAAATMTSPFGSYVNHNHFAGFVVMATLVAAGLTLGSARRAEEIDARTVALGGLTLGLAAVVVASRSRGGVVALAAGLACLCLGAWAGSRAERRRPATLLLGGAAVIVVLGFAVAVVPEATRTHLSSLLRGPDASGTYRIDTAAATLRLAASRPLLGSGLGAYADALPAFKRDRGEVRTTHAECDALELLAEAGLAGLAAAGWLLAAIASGFADRLAHGRDPHRKALALGAAAAAVALAIHSFFDFNLRIPANALLGAAVAGFAGAPREEPRRAGRWTAWLGLALAACAFGAAGWRAVGAARLERALALPDPQFRIARLDRTLAMHPLLVDGFAARAAAWEALATGPARPWTTRLERAAADLERAVRLRPRWAAAWADLGWVRHLQGDGPGGMSALDRAVALDPTDFRLSAMRAEVLGRRGRAEEAVTEILRTRERSALWSASRAREIASGWTADEDLLRRLH